MTSDATTDPPNFGHRCTILNLDWMSILIGAVENSAEGQDLIANYMRWNEAVHKKTPHPLTIFTSLSFARGRPEVERNKPFANLIAPFGTFEVGSPEVQIDSRFKVDEKDLVLPKTRWAATTGNALEQILKAQGIETVIISGLTLSGVVMSTIYRLFDLDYNIFVIEDNVVELPVDQTAEFKTVMLDKLLAKMNLKTIRLDQALKLLEQSA